MREDITKLLTPKDVSTRIDAICAVLVTGKYLPHKDQMVELHELTARYEQLTGRTYPAIIEFNK